MRTNLNISVLCAVLLIQPVSAGTAKTAVGVAAYGERSAPLNHQDPPNARGAIKIPKDVVFKTETLFRSVGGFGDNWCTTWAADDSQITSMDDGTWISGDPTFHNMTYRIEGEAENFKRSRIAGYPEFHYGNEDQPGWFGYGIVAINETIYSMVSRTPSNTFQGPFRGVKMLKSTDNGQSWYRVNKNGDTRLVTPTNDVARNSIVADDMFFMEEFGRTAHGQTAYPFSWVSFVQNGQAASASPDGYIYIYAPESSQANQLLLARAKEEEFEQRDNWEYFKQWNGSSPVWTTDISQRGNVLVYPEKNSKGQDFSWYSWLPSVVWNEGLGVYVMANGGVYANNYNWDWLDVSGSLGFWYSENPYGPWTQFYYTDHFIVDDPKNRTYQPKLSPKWISDNGEEMVLIWSDAMANEDGQTHTVNYRWNQMKINLVIE